MIKFSINKVFYVFPFTTLITQTAQTLKDTLSVKDVEVFEMHSKAEMGSKKYESYIKNPSYYQLEFFNLHHSFVLSKRT